MTRCMICDPKTVPGWAVGVLSLNHDVKVLKIFFIKPPVPCEQSVGQGLTMRSD